MIKSIVVEGRTIPFFACDKCGARLHVKRAKVSSGIKSKDGIVQYNNDGTFKMVCANYPGHPGCDKDDDENGWHELGTFLVYLLDNTGFKDKDHRPNAEALASI